ncbi:unnamed protein product [Moneuplotes crassus]|uniref:Cyclic nucleotide-binding domain-containing protein n=1 Tax=Euplotes crassus TaxID=5936 RepID=A0AAD1XH92_EUPCR|nr:unnamed protein product [Moneuplotes crassus]
MLSIKAYKRRVIGLFTTFQIYIQVYAIYISSVVNKKLKRIKKFGIFPENSQFCIRTEKHIIDSKISAFIKRTQTLRRTATIRPPRIKKEIKLTKWQKVKRKLCCKSNKKNAEDSEEDDEEYFAKVSNLTEFWKKEAEKEGPHNSVRARKNWATSKRRLLLQKFIACAPIYRDSLAVSQQKLNSRIIDYFTSFAAITDLCFCIYYFFKSNIGGLLFILLFPIFMVYMGLNFREKYHNGYHWVNDYKMIAINYLKFNFWFDLLSTFPFTIFHWSLVIFRFLKFMYFYEYLECICDLVKYTRIKKNRQVNLQKIIKFLIFFVFLINLFACFWIYVGESEAESSWIVVNQELDMNDENYDRDVYIGSVYFIIATFSTVGYGDVTGVTSGELIFQLIIEFAGVCIFGFITGNIGELFVSSESIFQLKEKKIDEVNFWLLQLQRAQSAKILHVDYFNHINNFYTICWDKDFGEIEKSEFYKQLKPKLQNELCDSLFDLLYNEFSSFFDQLETDFNREIAKKLKYQHFEIFEPFQEKYKKDKHSMPPTQDCCILPKGFVPNGVYFILKGQVFGSNNTGRYCYFKLREKSQFGETHLIDNIPLEYSIHYDVQQAVSTLFISKSDFMEACRKYPYSKQIIQQRSEVRRRTFKQLKLETLNDVIVRACSLEALSENYERCKAKIDLYRLINPALIEIVVLNNPKIQKLLKERCQGSSYSLDNMKKSIFTDKDADKSCLVEEEKHSKILNYNDDEVKTKDQDDINTNEIMKQKSMYEVDCDKEDYESGMSDDYQEEIMIKDISTPFSEKSSNRGVSNQWNTNQSEEEDQENPQDLGENFSKRVKMNNLMVSEIPKESDTAGKNEDEDWPEFTETHRRMHTNSGLLDKNDQDYKLSKPFSSKYLHRDNYEYEGGENQEETKDDKAGEKKMYTEDDLLTPEYKDKEAFLEARKNIWKSVNSLEKVQKLISKSKWIQFPYKNEICEEFYDLYQNTDSSA